MRIIVWLKANDNFLPIDYRPAVMGLFKAGLSQRYPSCFEKIQVEGKKEQKNYCFAVVLNNYSVQDGRILLKDGNFSLIISSYDRDTITMFYESINSLGEYTIDIPSYNTSITVQRVRLVNKKEITEDCLTINFLSPLAVRINDNDQNEYIYYDHPRFNDYLQISIKNMFIQFGSSLNGEVLLTPINPKKLIVKLKKTTIQANGGKFEISGDREVLNYLYLSGIGSRRSQGFGLFELVENI